MLVVYAQNDVAMDIYSYIYVQFYGSFMIFLEESFNI